MLRFQPRRSPNKSKRKAMEAARYWTKTASYCGGTRKDEPERMRTFPIADLCWVRSAIRWDALFFSSIIKTGSRIESNFRLLSHR